MWAVPGGFRPLERNLELNKEDLEQSRRFTARWPPGEHFPGIPFSKACLIRTIQVVL